MQSRVNRSEGSLGFMDSVDAAALTDSIDSVGSIAARTSASHSSLLWLLTGAALAVRLAFLLLHRIDSDEPQHLHVAWAWSQGLVQYRDLFDNHLPLLHLLFAPVVAIAPNDSSVFLFIRLAIAPIALGCSLLLFFVARTLLDSRRAAAAALTFSVMPVWLPKSVEFRNDTLWIFFWLAALCLVVARRRPAPLLAGVAAGLCLLASVKALPLFLAHACALFVSTRRPRWNDAARAAAGAAIPVALLVALMASLGALDAMLYDTLLFNASAPVSALRRFGGAAAFFMVAPALALAAPRALRTARPLTAHLTLFALWYAAILCCFWPVLTARDFLPLVPLAALMIASASSRSAVPAAAVIAGTLVSGCHAHLWRPRNDSRQRFVDAVVRITRPGDSVFDLKGDAVFRRRPVSVVYEGVSVALTARGLLPDHGPEEIARAGCCAAIGDSSHIPPRTRAFLNEHFIDAGSLRVCGTEVTGGAFTIAVPQTYAVIAGDASAVSIDGTPYRGPRFLAAGRHTISGTGSAGARVVWARAATAIR